MKSWIRSGLYTMLFLLLLFIIIFIFYREYLVDILIEDYQLFDDRYVYNKIENYELNFEENNHTKAAVDKMTNLYVTILEMNADSFTDHLLGDDKKRYDAYVMDESHSLLERQILTRQANSEINVKGNNAFNDRQNSFKIRLFENEGTWNDQQILNLEKQEADPLRIRNKLSLDLMEDIPRLFSLKSSFVRLFIKDIYDDPDTFYDYGLFVQVEHVDDLYFINRQINPTGYLYEVNNYKFENVPLSLLEDDDAIDTKGERDDKKFDELIISIHDTEITTRDLVDKYFEEEHLINWMAINLFIGNKNINERDYYLFSPITSDRWYFIPDDCDAAFGRIGGTPSWKEGLGVYYNNALFRRIIEDDIYRNMLVGRVEELSMLLTESYITDKLEVYYDEFFNNLTNEPDFASLEFPFEEFRDRYYALAKYPSHTIPIINQSIYSPLPFRVEAVVNEKQVTLSGLDTTTFDGTPVSYEIVVSRDREQSEIYRTYETTDTSFAIDLPEGVFYISILALSGGYDQPMANVYENEFGNKTHGIIRVEIQ